MHINGTIRQVLSVHKNVATFHNLANTILQNKILQRTLKGSHFGATEEQLAQLQDMLTNGTTMEVIKKATLEELADNNLSLWQRIKNKFKKTTSV
jgi:hypothetical protein